MAITKDIKTSKSVQEIWNLGFDTEFNLPIVEGLVYNPVSSGMDRAVQAGNMLPTSGNNPSLTLTYTANVLQTVTKVINGVSYTKTLTYTGTDLTGVSAWVQI